MISFKMFKKEIKKILPESSTFFSVMSDTYYADYKPKYPEKTSADMTVCYCFTSHEAKIYGNLYSLVPTIIKFDCFEEMFEYLSGVDCT